MAKRTPSQIQASVQKGLITRYQNKFMNTANADSMDAAGRQSNLQSRNYDGWLNILTGLGMQGYDKKEHTRFQGDIKLGEAELRDILTYNGLGKRIINLKAEDMLRNWYTIEGDTDNLIPNYYSQIKGKDNGNGKREIYRALKWARGYGGALVVIGAMDGRDLTEPLDENNIQNVEFLHTFHRFRVSRVQYYLDASKSNYWETEIYMVNPVRGAGYQVHESRCLIFDGEEVPPEVRLMNYGWGDSVIQAIYSGLRGMGESYAGCEHIIQEYILTYLQITGLANLLASGNDKDIMTRLNIMDMSKHSMNTVLLDKDEAINRISASVSGLPDLVGKLIQRVSSESGYPVRKLFGEVNVGSSLGNNNEGDMEDYYASVKSDQEEKLTGPLERLSRLIMLSKNGPTNGQEIKPKEASEWKICFPPLKVESQAAIVEQRGKQADIDAKYIEAGVLDPMEIRDSRFGGSSYSHDTKLDASLKEEDLAPEETAGNDEPAGGPGNADPSGGLQNVKTGVHDGGEGSGNFNHEGRPGEIGGSGEGGGGGVKNPMPSLGYHNTLQLARLPTTENGLKQVYEDRKKEYGEKFDSAVKVYGKDMEKSAQDIAGGRNMVDRLFNKPIPDLKRATIEDYQREANTGTPSGKEKMAAINHLIKQINIKHAFIQNWGIKYEDLHAKYIEAGVGNADPSGGLQNVKTGVHDGGEGSGNFNHEGRPGEQGGSGEGGGGVKRPTENTKVGWTSQGGKTIEVEHRVLTPSIADHTVMNKSNDLSVSVQGMGFLGGSKLIEHPEYGAMISTGNGGSVKIRIPTEHLSKIKEMFSTHEAMHKEDMEKMIKHGRDTDKFFADRDEKMQPKYGFGE